MQIYFRTVITRLLFRYLVVVVVGCSCPGRGLPVDVGQVAGVLQGLSDLLWQTQKISEKSISVQLSTKDQLKKPFEMSGLNSMLKRKRHFKI